jgi:hypothetical protein
LSSKTLSTKIGGLVITKQYEKIHELLFTENLLSDKEFRQVILQLAFELPKPCTYPELLTYALTTAAELEIKAKRFETAEMFISEAKGQGAKVSHLQEQLKDALRAKSYTTPFLEQGNTRVKPAAKLITSSKEAEIVAKDWMTYWGFTAAKITKDGPDGGIDVVSQTAIAQVKLEGKPVGPRPIQALAGIATVEKKQGLFFALTGYTKAALEFADKAKISLFQFDLQGNPKPMNAHARAISK